MSTPFGPKSHWVGRSLSQQRAPASNATPRILGCLRPGPAAAAPSVAVAAVPFSLFVAAGKGAAWAVLIGLAIAVLIATTISFQAKRTCPRARWAPIPAMGWDRASPYAAGFSSAGRLHRIRHHGHPRRRALPRLVPGVDRTGFPGHLVQTAARRGHRRRSRRICRTAEWQSPRSTSWSSS